MVDKKISELTQITGANVDDANDEFAIVDSSASETKAITRAELFSSVSSMSLSGGTIDGTTIGGTTPAAGTFTDTTTDTATLTAIAESKSDTAVDVFVYDTSKDSDGGAWRHRTQHTSWYNETLNTATRGSRREFPAVAVIVSEADRVTIYDGDDPALPMWMVFLKGGTSAKRNLIGQGADVLGRGLKALNGLLVSATTARGIRITSFVEDAGYLIDASKFAKYKSSVADRNANSGFATLDPAKELVNNNVNDVAMTVLPDAPIDPATGLPVPTIAVATDGGVSVIKDDGTVVDSNDTGNVPYVDFNDTGSLVTIGGQGADDIQVIEDYQADGFSPDRYYAGEFVLPHLLNDNVQFGKTLTKNTLSGVDAEGLFLIKEEPSDQTKGMVAYTTSTYNTGWMNGDIKLAALSDTDDTDLVGSGELVTNGTFDTDTSGWTDSTAFSSTFDANTINVAYTAGAGGSFFKGAFQTISTVVGETYVLTADVTAVSSNLGRIRVETGVGNGQNGQISSLGVGSHTHTFTATATTTYINLCMQSDATGSVNYDNISVKLADPDRSVNGNGLQVFGTVTKNPVATGADLVAYSGWSNNNYMKQPYNASLPTGGSDPFAVMMWFKVTGINATEVVLQFGANTTGQLRQFNMNATGNPYFAMSGQNTGNSQECEDNVWHHWATVHDGNKNISTFIDGRLIHTQLFSGLTDATTEEPLWLGNDYNGDNGFSGSLALLRISATAPTAEQIAKIYEDEKVLFQENAQATLYGASDAVTALAHDPVTDLLHVGTSAGRSVFQGLRRVSNTTDAVTTAISASNDLIVEQ